MSEEFNELTKVQVLERLKAVESAQVRMRTDVKGHGQALEHFNKMMVQESGRVSKLEQRVDILTGKSSRFRKDLDGLRGADNRLAGMVENLQAQIDEIDEGNAHQARQINCLRRGMPLPPAQPPALDWPCIRCKETQRGSAKQYEWHGFGPICEACYEEFCETFTTARSRW